MSREAKIIGILGGVSALILIGGLVLFGSGPTTKTPTAVNLVPADSYQTGPAGAKVTVVEFADFQCPACAAAAPVVEQLQQDYADKVKFVFRHFPLSIHANALLAASAAEAAGNQGKFWEMYAVVYRDQSEWSTSSSAEGIFGRYATNLGLDRAKFNKAMNDYLGIDRIRRDQADGNALGVNSTPTFFINGQKYSGALSRSQFKALLDPLLTN